MLCYAKARKERKGNLIVCLITCCVQVPAYAMLWVC